MDFVHFLALAGGYARVVGSIRHTRRVILSTLLLSGGLYAVDVPATLQVASTMVRPGGMAQIRVSLATPQAIAIGAFSMDFDPAFFGEIADVHVLSAAGDVIGSASINGRHVDVHFSSPSGGVGRLPGLPAATVEIPILPNVTAGAITGITVDPRARPWKDPNGTVYALTVEPGIVTAGGTLAIQNVTPGGGLLTAGSVLRVEGSGFRPDTVIEVPGVALASVVYVEATRVDITLGGPAELTGKRVRAMNTDGSSADYVSVLRGIPSEPSAVRIRPLFPVRTHATIRTGTRPNLLGGTRSIALENQNSTAVEVQVELIGLLGGLAGRKTIRLQPGGIFVQELGALGVETFGYGGLLPSQPVRAVALSTPVFPSGPPVASEVQSYTRFRLPDVPLDAHPASLSFRHQIGAPAPDPQTIHTQSREYTFEGVGFTASAATNNGGTWLSVTPARGSTLSTPSLTAMVDSAALAPGSYSGTITITPSVQSSKPVTIPVTLEVSAQPFIDVTNLTSTSFSAAPGAQAPPPRSFTVVSTGSSVAVAVSASTRTGGNWLSVTSSAGTTPATIGFSVNPAGLPVGSYEGTIAVQGPSNTVSLTVSLFIAVPPVPKLESLSPAFVDFSFQAGEVSRPVGHLVRMDNPFRLPFALGVRTDSGGNWLTAALSSAGTGNSFNVAVDPSLLAPGTYTGTVLVTATEGSSTLELPVKVTIWSGATPPLTVTPSALVITRREDQVQTESLLVESGGVPLELKLEPRMPPDSCTLFAAPDQTILPPQPLTPVSVKVSCFGGPGVYSGSITVTAGSNSVVVPVSVRILPAPYSGTITPPVIGSVVNAAFGRAGAMAPGEIITIHGSGVGTRDPAGIAFDTSGGVTRNLNGLRVLFDGLPAPLIYTSLFQTNLIVPYEIAGRQTTSIQVDAGGSLSEVIALPVAAAAPGIFTLSSSGIGPAAVLNEDHSMNDPANPTARGSIIQIYATGEGQTVPVGVTGSVTEKDTKHPVLPVKVQIGGAYAQVMYAGSAPEAVAGLFQVNAVVPDLAPSGSAIPLTLKVGDSQTEAGVTIAIR